MAVAPALARAPSRRSKRRRRRVTAAAEADEARAACGLEAGRLAGEIEACLDELEQVGCIFKGFEAGLVDFPALSMAARSTSAGVMARTRIEHWHEVETGFAGRQPDRPSHNSR